MQQYESSLGLSSLNLMMLTWGALPYLTKRCISYHQNMKESSTLFNVKKQWVKLNLFDFTAWLEKIVEAHALMNKSATKAKTEDDRTSGTKTKTA